MEPIDIGLWVSAGLLVFVVLGMRVAFAAGLAGFVGLVWLRWNGFDYDPERFWKSVEISVKIAGLTPHSKVSAQVLSLIPVFIMIGYLAYYAKLTTALFTAAKRWIAWVPGGLGCINGFCHRGLCGRVWRVGCDGGCFCADRHPRDAEDWLQQTICRRRGGGGGHTGIADPAVGNFGDLCDHRRAGRGQTVAGRVPAGDVFGNRLCRV